MIRLPELLISNYNHFMVRSNIATGQQGYFRKWLLYYCDFCHKYQKPYDSAESLDAFLDKLAQKKQPLSYRNQAADAISFYFKMLRYRESVPAKKDDSVSYELTGNTENGSGKDWSWVYARLEEQIKVRHYSPKTWRSYRSWARQLQAFVRSKDALELDVEDVKKFLNYLSSATTL